MKYRPEVDGLRAVAVVPVLLCHGEVSGFTGGFVGVDIFFVISGYLISTIIMSELDSGRFSVLAFYERRSRRILPALFLVMLCSIPPAYAWMLPDEFKNFGQSLIATSLFSNNILLALTSDYWSLASDYKPFLHTWSLGVEEQFYIFFPLMLFAGWRYARRHILLLLGVLFVLSFALAAVAVLRAPSPAFYLLPTRGWELLAGAVAAYSLRYSAPRWRDTMLGNALAALGLALIAVAIFVFDETFLSPGPWILFPVLGSVLVILYAFEGTLAYRFLASRVMVGIGLISYSLYLWHQPLFALARIYAVDKVNVATYGALFVLTFVLAYLTWRFVEAPFRNRQAIGRPAIFAFSIVGSLALSGVGLYLDRTYGLAAHTFGRDINIADMDKRIYNERVFRFKKTAFNNDGGKKILILGNSFGRDFVNMTTEEFGATPLDIVYSDLFDVCIASAVNARLKPLFDQADIVVFASGFGDRASISRDCVAQDIAWSQQTGKTLFFAGPKHFGNNLNWAARVAPTARGDLYNPLPEAARRDDERARGLVPAPHFISLLAPIVVDNRVPITDHAGRMLSVDRVHVTKYGAIFLGARVLRQSAYGALLARG